MTNQKNKVFPFWGAFLLLFVFQAVRAVLCAGALRVLPQSAFVEKMVTMSVMILLTAAVVIYAKCRKVPLSLLPARFGRGDLLATVITAALYISAPSNYMGGFQPVFLLLYGSIVTPVYEELLFRGYLWNRWKPICTRELTLCAWNVFFFTLWHLGYMGTQLLSGNLTAVFGKLIAGFCYGIVLAFVRVKAKNCYATILTHGVLNLFMV